MDNSDISINELPFEILMEIFEYFTIPEIARFPMTCTHWRDLMQQDHFWASLARKTYGQYVGETPTKKLLEELSKQCDQELTFMHWLQYRSLFGLTMNMAVHVAALMPDNVFGYKVTLEPGLNMVQLVHDARFNGYQLDLGRTDGVGTSSWNATFNLVVTPEDGGEQIRKRIPLISFADTSVHEQIRHQGKVYKYKLKLTKLMATEFIRSAYFYGAYKNKEQPLDALMTAKHVLFPDMNMTLAIVGFKLQTFKSVYRYQNPFLYAPTCSLSGPGLYYSGSNASFIYQDLKVHEYVPLLAKNFNDAIRSQMQLYLAEIVCGFESLHENGLYLADSIPVMKKDGHLQFIYAGPRDFRSYSSFGLAPERYPGYDTSRPSCTQFQTECYSLGVFMLEVCSGDVFMKRVNQIIVVTVPHDLSVELKLLISTLVCKHGKERPKNIATIKKDPYFKGIDWSKMRKQQWSPKFLPNLE